MRPGVTRLSIDLDKDLYKLIKHAATFEEQTIKDFVVEAIWERLKGHPPEQWREVNELTRITLEKADRGEDLHRYDSVDDFIRSC